MKKRSLILSGLFSASIALANQLSYDHIPITSRTWEEVDLTYTNTIDGEKYTEQAKLLRPIDWVKQNHLDNKGAHLHLGKEQLGIEADVKVMAIKPTKLNYINNNHENIKPVIAIFITHSKDVWAYTFKDQQGHKETVQAVSSHPFYVPRLNSYMPIGQIGSGEQLTGSNGNNVTLVGKMPLNQVESVYNFEAYQKHRYFVGNSISILVHNPRGRTVCTLDEYYDDLVNRNIIKEENGGQLIELSPDEVTRVGFLGTEEDILTRGKKGDSQVRDAVRKRLTSLGFKKDHDYWYQHVPGKNGVDTTTLIYRWRLIDIRKNPAIVSIKEYEDNFRDLMVSNDQRFPALYEEFINNRRINNNEIPRATSVQGLERPWPFHIPPLLRLPTAPYVPVIREIRGGIELPLPNPNDLGTSRPQR